MDSDYTTVKCTSFSQRSFHSKYLYISTPDRLEMIACVLTDPVTGGHDITTERES